MRDFRITFRDSLVQTLLHLGINRAAFERERGFGDFMLELGDDYACDPCRIAIEALVELRNGDDGAYDQAVMYSVVDLLESQLRKARKDMHGPIQALKSIPHHRKQYELWVRAWYPK